MSTPAQRAALRILSSTPPDHIHTHDAKPRGVYIPGLYSGTQNSQYVRKFVLDNMGTMRLADMARTLEVPKYIINNHIRAIRGKANSGRRRRCKP